jgi:uncharacterized protein YkwD
MGNACSEDNSQKDNEIGMMSGKRIAKGRIFGESFLQEVNTMRRNPAAYARKIEDMYTKKFSADTHTPSGIKYIEGQYAFAEVENFLRMQPALPELMIQGGLVASSYDQAIFVAQTKMLSSVGRGGSHLMERINQYGILQSDKVGEASIIVKTSDPSNVVIELLADDGVVDRRNRYALLDPKYRFLGCCMVKDNTGDFYIVIDLAEEYRTDPSKATEDILIKAELAGSM